MIRVAFQLSILVRILCLKQWIQPVVLIQVTLEQLHYGTILLTLQQKTLVFLGMISTMILSIALDFNRSERCFVRTDCGLGDVVHLGLLATELQERI